MRQTWRELRLHINQQTFSVAFIAAIFGFAGPALIIIGGATSGGLSYVEMMSWIFSIYVLGGAFGIFMSLKYKQPIIGAYTIAGAVLVIGSFTAFSFSDIIGAYVITHVIILLLSVTGLVDKVIQFIPSELVMAMIVGVLIHFAIEMIQAIEIAPILTLSTIFAFLLSSRLWKKVSPILTALLVSVIGLSVMGEFELSTISTPFIIPKVTLPTFDLQAILSISLPLALIIICVENAQATNVLKAAGFTPPNNAIAKNGAIFSLIVLFFGGHAANVAGPMTAICATDEAGPKEGRYAAGVINGIFMMVFGLLSSFIIPFIIVIPQLILTMIAGLAMLGVLITCLKAAFSSPKFQLSAFFALIIDMSGLSFFHISAPLWAIVGSLLVSFINEREHYVP